MRLFSWPLLLMCALALPAQAQHADSIPVASAYLDAPTAELVRLARQRRQVADLSIDAYKVLSKERISVGLRGIRRDRLLYRREVAARIEWSRSGPARIEVLGAREAIPVAVKNVQLPSDLTSFMPHLAFDPADNRLLVGWGDNQFVRHPLVAGAERYYQYRTGTTTTIRLPDGKAIRLIELQIIPRVSDPHNISGSFWLESDSHAVVQAAFRLARDLDVMRDIDDDDPDDDMPGFLKPVRFTVDYVTIEYSLYDLQWWLPRSVLFEGTLRAGMIRSPMHYERTYSQFEVRASPQPITTPIAELMREDSLRRAQQASCDNRKKELRIVVGGARSKPGAARNDSTIVTECGRWSIAMSTDTAALLNSAELPANVFASGEELVTEGELRELQNRIEKLGGGPSMLPTPVTDFALFSVRQLRYNRVEGLSIGARGDLDYGAYHVLGSARIGVADLSPNFELSVERPGNRTTLTAGLYRRLNPFDPASRPFSLGASLSALVFGRDEADYYRSLGAELKIEPNGNRARWYSLRLFGQRESGAKKETDFSLHNVLNGDYEFRPNLPATAGNEYGSELTLRVNHGLDPDGLRVGAEVYGHGAVGTNEFGRGALTLRAGFPLPGPFTGALEAASGLTTRDAPLQHLWYVGGANTLRGYNASTLGGDAFWRGRAEIGFGLPAVRLVGFSDVGWAGARAQYPTARPLLSVGAGASLLDGLVRFDIARGLRAPRGWSATLYFDAVL